MNKQYKTHKEQLCTGTMQLVVDSSQLGNGNISSWKCDTCDKTLPTHKNPLHHVAMKKDTSR